MVRVDEYKEKMQEIKNHIRNSKGQQRMQYIKRLHRMQKEIAICYSYLKETERKE